MGDRVWDEVMETGQMNLWEEGHLREDVMISMIWSFASAFPCVLKDGTTLHKEKSVTSVVFATH